MWVEEEAEEGDAEGAAGGGGSKRGVLFPCWPYLHPSRCLVAGVRCQVSGGAHLIICGAPTSFCSFFHVTSFFLVFFFFSRVVYFPPSPEYLLAHVRH